MSDSSTSFARVRLSVVVPCYNEEDSIREMHRVLVQELESVGLASEILYVDDGSTDATLQTLRGLHSDTVEVRTIVLSRNFGHQTAVTAGIDMAKGDAVVLIDADLQDPPSVIGSMVELWEQGYDVVYGRRRTRAGETIFKRLSAKLYYRALRRFSATPIPLDTGDFRLMSRRVVECLRQMPERDRFLRGMVAWVGFRQGEVLYDRDARYAGSSKYPLAKMIRFAADGILSFSTEPLKAVLKLGLAVVVVSFIGILYALSMRLFTSDWVSGWTLLIIAVLFLGGTQLLCLGLIGEYVARIYLEAKGRPLYFFSEDPRTPFQVSEKATVLIEDYRDRIRLVGKGGDER